MIRTQVYLNDQQYNLAKLYTEQEGSAFAEAVREGLDLWIAEHQKKMEKKQKKHKKAFEGFIGTIKTKGKKGSSRAALDHNDIYDDVLPWDRPDWQG